MNEKWFVVINPVSGGKKAIVLWAKIKPLLDDASIPFETAFTQHLNHGSSLATNACNAGFINFLIIGGDGTAHDVTNGIFNSETDPQKITIAMIPAGTGNDWVRTIGRYKDIKDIVVALRRKITFLHDVGYLKFASNAVDKKIYFINIAGVGFEGLVVKSLRENKHSFKGGRLQYWIAILRSLVFCNHTNVTVDVDGVTSQYKCLSIACGICRYNGSGLKQLPDAEFDDGLLDMTLIGDMSKLKMVISLPKLTNGSHVKMKEVKTFRGKEIKIKSDTPIYVEADGEYLGSTPVSLSCLKDAIRIIDWNPE